MGTIKDPEAKKPEDWDDRAKIADPEAKKPEDWDDEMDGEWEPPMIDNPEYKGEWKPRQIDNPSYAPDASIGKFEEICAVGFDLWQVKSGTIFDNVLITDDAAEAKKIGDELFKATSKAEKKMKDAQDEEERKKMEEEDEDDEDADDADDAEPSLPAAGSESADHDE